MDENFWSNLALGYVIGDSVGPSYFILALLYIFSLMLYWYSDLSDTIIYFILLYENKIK